MKKSFLIILVMALCSCDAEMPHTDITDDQLDQLYRNSFKFDQVPKEEWVLESENAFVLEDKYPQAPVHLLVISKNVYPTMLQAPSAVLGEMLDLGRQAAKKYGIEKSGFRTVINTHPDGGQGVYHLHIHILGSRQMQWPPG